MSAWDVLFISFLGGVKGLVIAGGKFTMFRLRVKIESVTGKWKKKNSRERERVGSKNKLQFPLRYCCSHCHSVQMANLQRFGGWKHDKKLTTQKKKLWNSSFSFFNIFGVSFYVNNLFFLNKHELFCFFKSDYNIN